MDTLKNTSQSYTQGKNILHRMMLLLAFGILTISATAQDIVRITGKVLDADTKEPLMGVNILDIKADRKVGETDFEGSFAFSVRRGTRLRFTMVGAEPVIYKVGDKTEIEITMKQENLINELVIPGSRKAYRARSKAKMVYNGNRLKIFQEIKIKKALYSPRFRFVAQPVLFNLTRNTYQMLPPIVHDADQYHLTQNRLYDYDMKQRDPIGSNIVLDITQPDSGLAYTFNYADSVYVENPGDDVRYYFFQAAENYIRILDRDTVCVASGVVNPLRFLEYSLVGIDLNDPKYIPPKDQAEPRASKGKLRLNFGKGESTLNIQDSINRQSLEKMERDMRAITSNPDASLYDITIMGTASPDGPYSLNKNLAEGRMKSALNEIMKFFSPEERKKIGQKFEARVATWEEVVELLRRDTLNNEADQIEAIIQKHKSMDEQGRAIKNLDFYQMLLDKYLPKLRRVEYVLNYTIYRELTDEEIKEQYKKDYKLLSNYQMYRLFSTETDEQQREEYLTKAIEKAPRFVLAANQLAVLKIKKGQPDAELLKNHLNKSNYPDKKVPYAVRLNHTIALLHNKQYEAADSLRNYLDAKQPETRMVKAVCDAFLGYYDEAYPVLAETGDHNKALMLLAMERDQEALNAAQNLQEDKAISHYILAVCLKRNNKLNDAEVEIQKAVQMDPSLRAIAENDSDLNSLTFIRGDKQEEADDHNIPDRPWKKVPQWP